MLFGKVIASSNGKRYTTKRFCRLLRKAGVAESIVSTRLWYVLEGNVLHLNGLQYQTVKGFDLSQLSIKEG